MYSNVGHLPIGVSQSQNTFILHGWIIHYTLVFNDVLTCRQQFM